MSDIGAILETGGAAAVELAASALSERGGKIGHCANCHEPLLGPYCAVCGQPRDIHRRSLWGLLHDLVKDLVSFDSRILRTARALMLRPGELAKAYHEGRTQPFVPPVRLYLFVSLIFFLALSTAHIAIFQFDMRVDTQIIRSDAAGHIYIEKNGQRTPMPGFSAAPDGHIMVAGHRRKTKLGDKTYTVAAPPQFLQRIGHARPAPPEVRAVMENMRKDTLSQTGDGLAVGIEHFVYLTLSKVAQNPAALNAPMTEWLPRILFLLLPLFALVLSLFYWRQRSQFFFVDHLVFSLNYHSFGFALLVLVLAPAQFVAQSVLFVMLWLAMGLYLFLAMKRFYGQSWLWTTVKFLVFGFIYTSFILSPAFIGLLTVSVLNA
jgi:hypothetical protein